MDSANQHLWRIRALETSKLNDKQAIAEQKRQISETKFATTTLDRLSDRERGNESNFEYCEDNAQQQTIGRNWDESDDVLAQDLRLSLSGIIDIAHDWASRYIKPAFSDTRWSIFVNQSTPLYNLTEESSGMYNNVVAVSCAKILN
ncbi:hypothetical protein HPULCUR_011605 [Helicostylum pulchrum]|uniref:Uncharacterized protein n=1 Tax=Helicostylum pulchrum TaxID=562976 RepID=A0ABP9YHY6_9FUNG